MPGSVKQLTPKANMESESYQSFDQKENAHNAQVVGSSMLYCIVRNSGGERVRVIRTELEPYNMLSFRRTALNKRESIKQSLLCRNSHWVVFQDNRSEKIKCLKQNKTNLLVGRSSDL